MIQANCPSCGDIIPFHSEYSSHAVCASCDSLVVRQGSGLENLGKVAEIQQDGTALQLGAHGSYDGRTFQIIGRIQLRYSDGFWNEWHLIFSDGLTGWLGEAMGEYFLSFKVDAGGGLPGRSAIALGDRLSLGGEVFVVSGYTTNRLSAYEGEIPFLVDHNESFAAYDLRSASGKAATIDYSDNPPSLFLGEYKTYQELRITGGRVEGQAPQAGMGIRVPAQPAIENFNCPSCGAPHSVVGGVRSKVLVCEYCGSAVDLSSSKLEVIWQELSMRRQLQMGTEIPLGSKGRIDDLDYTIIGYVKKSVTYEGTNYPWVEYLLYSFTGGYRWLVESDGHYTLMETIPNVPTSLSGGPVGRPDAETVRWSRRDFKHFQTSNAIVEAVAGEFYWKVQVGESVLNFDYISPPETLSVEVSETGLVWSHGVYKTPDEVRALFGLTKSLQEPMGVAPAQPNPHNTAVTSIWRTFNFCALVGLVLMFTGMLSGSGKTVYATSGQVYKTYFDNPPQESEKFEIKGHGNVAFDFESKPTNRWIYLRADLVNQETQTTYSAGTTLERFHGKGSWSHRVRISGVPSGTYKLKWRAESGTNSLAADRVDKAKQGGSDSLNYSISLRRGVAVWGWYWLMVLVLIPLPILATSRRSSFETRRWYNSDYG